MSDTGQAFRAQVLLSIQRALWDMVTPDLRAVAVGWPNGSVRARFIFDRPLTGGMQEIVSEVETHVIADFDAGTSVRFSAEFAPADARTELRDGEGWWAYRRFEAANGLG
jgi:hypothetical protein